MGTALDFGFRGTGLQGSAGGELGSWAGSAGWGRGAPASHVRRKTMHRGTNVSWDPHILSLWWHRWAAIRTPEAQNSAQFPHTLSPHTLSGARPLSSSHHRTTAHRRLRTQPDCIARSQSGKVQTQHLRLCGRRDVMCTSTQCVRTTAMPMRNLSTGVRSQTLA